MGEELIESLRVEQTAGGIGQASEYVKSSIGPTQNVSIPRTLRSLVATVKSRYSEFDHVSIRGHRMFSRWSKASADFLRLVSQ